MTTEVIYAANIIREIQALESQHVTETVEKTAIVDKIKQLHLIIRDVAIKYHKNGRVKIEEWHIKNSGVVSRAGAPAVVIYYDDGIVNEENWYENWYDEGKLHRPGGAPAVTRYYKDGTVFTQEWYEHGKEHRVGAPHCITYHRNGNTKKEEWCTDGKEHRVDGPAIVSYYEDGKICSEAWYINGQRHRDHEPASTAYYKSGNVKTHQWYIHGIEHRDGGVPEYVNYYENGTIEEEWKYKNGELQYIDKYDECGNIVLRINKLPRYY